MTLSENLMELSAWFDAIRQGAHDFTPQGAAEFARRLDGAARAAYEMELAPAPARQPAAADNVLDLHAYITRNCPHLARELQARPLLRGIERGLFDHARSGALGPRDGDEGGAA